MLRRIAALLLLLPLLWACSSGDEVQRLAARLQHSEHREQAIDSLLVLVRQTPAKRRPGVRVRVVHALMEAYREDVARPEIVAALALLRDPHAEEVFVAALKDAARGGAHFEAAVRSARMIGELGLKKQVPVLISTLDRALAAPMEDRNTWLERSVIGALEALGDRSAVPVLIKALKANPATLDFYVSRLAARALGQLRDPRAVAPLVASLGATAHRLLLYEESRRALCRIGKPALPGLLAAARERDRHHRPAANAAAAVRVIADLGVPASAAKLRALATDGSPPDLVLDIGEALLRLGERSGQKLVLPLVQAKDASATTRRRAADILGWYGEAHSLLGLVRPSCTRAQGPEDPARDLVCWSAALALTRTAGPQGVELLDKVLAAGQDSATRHNLREYRVRLELVQRCTEDLDCYAKQLKQAADWRVRERAALELGRTGRPEATAAALAARLSGEHPQVRRAILVALEQLAPRLEDPAPVHEALDKMVQALGSPSDPHGATPPALVSRALCLDERLNSNNREKR